MNEPVIVRARGMVTTRTFVFGAFKHTDGLGGYVRDFLEENGGLVNENGREWTPESCANALKIPPRTLRRWMYIPADTESPKGSDQQGPAAFLPEERATITRRSNAKNALSDPEQRAGVIEVLSTEVRDELRADLIAYDLPDATVCRHCPNHCPEGSTSGVGS